MCKTGGKTDPKLFKNCQNVTKLPKNSFLSEKIDNSFKKIQNV